jgi:hypothetical protein
MEWAWTITWPWRGVGKNNPLEEEYWTLDEECTCLEAFLVDFHHLGV